MGTLDFYFFSLPTFIWNHRASDTAKKKAKDTVGYGTHFPPQIFTKKVLREPNWKKCFSANWLPFPSMLLPHVGRIQQSAPAEWFYCDCSSHTGQSPPAWKQDIPYPRPKKSNSTYIRGTATEGKKSVSAVSFITSALITDRRLQVWNKNPLVQKEACVNEKTYLRNIPD